MVGLNCQAGYSTPLIWLLSDTCVIKQGRNKNANWGGGGGVYSHIHVLPDRFLLNLSCFQKKSIGHNTNI